MIYEYSPVLPKKKEKLLCWLFLLLGASLFVGSMLPGLSFRWILQLFSFAFFVAFVMLFSLCIMRSYVYTVEEGREGSLDFVITEYYGRRRTVVCRVALHSVRSVVAYGKSNPKIASQKTASQKKFVYTAVLFDTPRYLVEFEEAEERFCVCICADDKLLQFLNFP